MVSVADDIYGDLDEHRHLRMAGLVAAFAKMPSSLIAEGRDYADHLVTNELRRRLSEAGVADWDDLDYDPARAATVLEDFRPVSNTPSSEDDFED